MQSTCGLLKYVSSIECPKSIMAMELGKEKLIWCPFYVLLSFLLCLLASAIKYPSLSHHLQ
jgi:hypothetical protein